MSGTYSKIYLHFVVNVEAKKNLLPNDYSDDICMYFTGTVQGLNFGHKMIRINCVPDHVHFLVGYRPSQSISDFMRDVKSAVSKYINSQRWMRFRFSWMEGYGCFSVGPEDLDRVCRYIDNQKEHHQRNSFDEEYRNLLRKYDIIYNPKYFLK